MILVGLMFGFVAALGLFVLIKVEGIEDVSNLGVEGCLLYCKIMSEFYSSWILGSKLKKFGKLKIFSFCLLFVAIK